MSTLTKVLLPDPLGPMSPWGEVLRPAVRLDRGGRAPEPANDARLEQAPDDPIGEEHDRGQDDPAVDVEVVLVQPGEDGRDEIEDHAPDERSVEGPAAAHEHRGEQRDRQREDEGVAVDEAVLVGEEHAAEARVGRADHEGEDLPAVDVDADRLRRDLAAAQGEQGAAHARGQQVVGDELAADRDERDEPEVLGRGHLGAARQSRARNGHDPHRAPGQAPAVGGHLRHEPERHRHHGEIRALGPEGRQSKEGSAEPGEGHAERRGDPERPAEPGGEERGGIGPHRVEPGVAERDLARPADEDVEPEGDDEEVGERLQHQDEERVVEDERKGHHCHDHDGEGQPLSRAGVGEERQSHARPSRCLSCP